LLSKAQPKNAIATTTPKFGNYCQHCNLLVPFLLAVISQDACKTKVEMI
jgi:hypothetical protein